MSDPLETSVSLGDTSLEFESHPAYLLNDIEPAYRTNLGVAYVCDSLDGLRKLPSDSINLVVTSPPYALHFKKEYGNVDKTEYVDWMLPFAKQIRRALVEDGSFVLNIGGRYNP